jgi:hypothetical protein
MSVWTGVLVASALVYSWKFFGYLIPEKFVANEKVRELATLLTVSLLAALVGIQTLGSASGITVDARLPAVIFAGVLFYLRVPFLVVVVSAALLAGIIRMFF